MWNDLPYTMFDTGTLDGFNGVVNRWLLSMMCALSLFRGADSCGVAKVIYYDNFVFPTWACAAGFNDNNNIFKMPRCFILYCQNDH